MTCCAAAAAVGALLRCAPSCAFVARQCGSAAAATASYLRPHCARAEERARARARSTLEFYDTGRDEQADGQTYRHARWLTDRQTAKQIDGQTQRLKLMERLRASNRLLCDTLRAERPPDNVALRCVALQCNALARSVAFASAFGKARKGRGNKVNLLALLRQSATAAADFALARQRRPRARHRQTRGSCTFLASCVRARVSISVCVCVCKTTRTPNQLPVL